jgi:ADP-ribosylglycohydrolase
MHRSHRVAGALVGSAVGDALGAPFADWPPGQFSARFPVPARGSKTEMCGGGSLGWEPGEFTNSTQLALVVASSLLERDGLDEADLVDRLRTWAGSSEPADGDRSEEATHMDSLHVGRLSACRVGSGCGQPARCIEAIDVPRLRDDIAARSAPDQGDSGITSGIMPPWP